MMMHLRGAEEDFTKTTYGSSRHKMEAIRNAIDRRASDNQNSQTADPRYGEEPDWRSNRRDRRPSIVNQLNSSRSLLSGSDENENIRKKRDLEE